MKDVGQKREEGKKDKGEICGGFYAFLKKVLRLVGSLFIWLLAAVNYCLKPIFNIVCCTLFGYKNRYRGLLRKEKTIFWNWVTIFFVVVLSLCVWLVRGQRPWLLLFVVPFSILFFPRLLMLFLSPTESAEKLNRFLVQPYWDNFPEIDPRIWDKFIFSGRKEILRKIKGWFFLTKGGSLLINGVRGVGKTALVYTAIQQWKYSVFWRRFGGMGFWRFPLLSAKYIFWCLSFFLPFLIRQKITVVPVDAGAIFQDKKVTPGKMKKDLIKAIIRSLKNAKIETADIRYQIDELFEVSISSKASDRKKISQTYKVRVGIKISDLNKIIESVIGIFFVSLLPLALKLLGLDIYLPVVYKFNLDYILPLLSGLSLLVAYVYERKYEKKSTLLMRKNGTEYLYTRLGEILDNEREIFVFIFDELDKLEKISVKEFVQYTKNLINLSNSKFVFLNSEKEFLEELIEGKHTDSKTEKEEDGATSEVTMESGDQQQKEVVKVVTSGSNISVDFFQTKYGVESTLFSWTVFLPNADAEDIKNYVREIVVLTKSQRRELDRCWKKVVSGQNLNVEGDGRLSDLLLLIFYLYYETGGVFNKVKNKIRSMLEYDFGSRSFFYRKVIPFLKFGKSSFISDEWNSVRRKAMLGYVMYRVYKDNHFGDIDHYLENFLLAENSAEYLRSRMDYRTFVSNYFEQRKNDSKLFPEQYKVRIKNHLDDLSRAVLNASINDKAETDEAFSFGSDLGSVKFLDLSKLPVVNGFTVVENELFVKYQQLRGILEGFGKVLGWGLSAMVDNLSVYEKRYNDGKIKKDYVEVAKTIGEIFSKTLKENSWNEETIFDGDLSSYVGGFLISRIPIDQSVLKEYLDSMDESIRYLKDNKALILVQILLVDILKEDVESCVATSEGVIVTANSRTFVVLAAIMNLIASETADPDLKDKAREWFVNTFRQRTIYGGMVANELKSASLELYSGMGQKPYFVKIGEGIRYISRVELEIETPNAGYWRAGFLLGVSDYRSLDGMVGAGKYPLFHLYKDLDNGVLRYRRLKEEGFGEGETEKKLDKPEYSLDKNITMIFEKDGKNVSVKLGDGENSPIEIDNFAVRNERVRNDFRYGYFAIWGDGYDWTMKIKKLKVEYR